MDWYYWLVLLIGVPAALIALGKIVLTLFYKPQITFRAMGCVDGKVNNIAIENHESRNITEVNGIVTLAPQEIKAPFNISYIKSDSWGKIRLGEYWDNMVVPIDIISINMKLRIGMRTVKVKKEIDMDEYLKNRLPESITTEAYDMYKAKIKMYSDIVYGRRWKDIYPGKYGPGGGAKLYFEDSQNWKKRFFSYAGEIDKDMQKDYDWIVTKFREGLTPGPQKAHKDSLTEFRERRTAFEERCIEKINFYREKIY